MSARVIKCVDAEARQTFAPFILPPLDGDAPNLQNQLRVAHDASARALQSANALTSEAANLMSEATRKAQTNSKAGVHAQTQIGVNAESLLSETQAQAQAIIRDAQARAADIERAAYEKGLSESRARFEAELASSVEDLRAQLAQTIEKIAGLEAEIFARAEQNLVRLALEIAKKVVRREVTLDGEIALTLVRVTLARLTHHTVAQVHLHPEDYKFISARAKEFGSRVELVEDRTIERGGCFVHTEMGDFDARLEHQFAEIERGLLMQP